MCSVSTDKECGRAIVSTENKVNNITNEFGVFRTEMAVMKLELATIKGLVQEMKADHKTELQELIKTLKDDKREVIGEVKDDKKTMATRKYDFGMLVIGGLITYLLTLI